MRRGGGAASPRPAGPAEASPPAGQAPERATGHAFYAAEARRALGVHPEGLWSRLPTVPLPVFQGTVALAASCLFVLARPQAVGYRDGALIDAALATVTCLAILHHARLVIPHGARPGPEVCVLPAAALLSLGVALGGTTAVATGAAAVVATAAVISLVPHLDALRVAGRDSLVVRIGLDVAGTVAMVPPALCGASSAVHPVVRAVLLLVGGAAITYDALRLADPLGRSALIGAVLTGALLAAASPVAARAGSQASGAAGLLLLWYGLRGLAGAAESPHRRLAALEYAGFVAGAVALLLTSRQA